MQRIKFFIKPVFYGFMLFVFSNFFMPEMVLAQAEESAVAFKETGPFAAFLTKAAKLFYQTRNALFVVAVFAFLSYAWEAISSGKVDEKKVFWLIVGLTILGVAGFIVDYMAGDKIHIQSQAQDELGNVKWSN